MTLSSVRTIISEISTFQNKVAYRAFPVGKAPKLPFVCYLATDTDNFDADNRVWKVIQNVDVELYTEKKSPDVEQKLEAAFDANFIPWDKTETWLEDEQCYEILYEISI